MTGLEIFLLIAGVAIMAVSFLFGEHFDSEKGSSVPIDEEQIRSAVKARVDEAVEEAIDEAVERTAAELDKMSNEKIMTVGDYLENTLSDVQKNHEEVMFLYGMLNDKEEQIKGTVKDVEMVKSSVKKMLQQIEKRQAGKKVKKESSKPEIKAEEPLAAPKDEIQKTDKEEPEKDTDKQIKEEITEEIKQEASQQENSDIPEESMNNNQKILFLHQKGMSNIDIAKELNLGMGEVRLVIDLYKTRGRE